MTKSTKQDTKKQVEETVEEIITDDEEIEDIESNNESESEEDTATEDKKKQKKMTASELYTEISDRFTILESVEASFIEKEKEFEKEQKEFHASRKKVMREMSGFMKRFEKAFASEVGKKKKPRKTENAGKGGFNKQADVPELLRNYIGINADEQKSRPEVTKLLNAKFNEDGLMTVKKENDKDIKVIILNKSVAKKLKRKENDEIRNKDIQTFIAQFYREAANNINA
jgi:hypothetical protein